MMKKIKTMILMGLSIMIIIVMNGCSAIKSGVKGTKTIMIYMIGSDLEAQYGFGSFNIDVIENSKIDLETTNVILRLGGSLNWQSDEVNKEGGLYELNQNHKLVEINHDKANMCNSDTLSDFLNYGYENYKTDSYDLILWDHGGGSILGYGYDEVYNSTLKLTDIKKALENSPFHDDNKLEVIGFDACLMSCIETGYILKDHGKYMVASQEVIPGYGWDYRFLEDVNGMIDGESLSNAIIDRYIDFYDDISKEQDVFLDTTLSCIDLNQIDEVEKNMNLLFKKVDTVLKEENANNSIFASLSTTRNGVKSFGKSANYNYDLVDLGALIDEFEKDYSEEVKALKNSLDKMIVYEDGNVDNASGVSIYYPYENISNISLYLKEYDKFDFAEEYYQYLLNFSRIIVEGNKKESQPLENIKLLAEKNEAIQRLTLELSQQEAKNYASSQYCILQKVEDMKNCYMPIYWDTDLTLNDTTLTANYNNKVMTLTSQGEQYPITLWQLDANEKYIRYQVPAIMFHYGEDFDDFKVIRSYYILHVDRQTLDIKVAGVVPADELDNHLAAKNYIDVSEYDSIEFMSSVMQAQFDSHGHPKAIRDWKSTGTMQGVSVKTSEKFEFEFMDISDGEFYATVMIQDIFGNYFGSDIQKLEMK